MDQELTAAPMAVSDLDQVLDIERASFPTPWTRAAFCYEIEQNKVARCTAMRARGGVVGYLCFWEIGHEIHITNLAVHPEWRRRGAARRLLAAALAEGVARGVTPSASAAASSRRATPRRRHSGCTARFVMWISWPISQKHR